LVAFLLSISLALFLLLVSLLFFLLVAVLLVLSVLLFVFASVFAVFHLVASVVSRALVPNVTTIIVALPTATTVTVAFNRWRILLILVVFFLTNGLVITTF
jgi:hypothetical protein